VAFHRGIDGNDPLRTQPATQEERRRTRSGRLAVGTLACPLCDAPVAPPPAGLAPADPLRCPFCSHRARVRDFLSLAPPSRPARVEVRVVARDAPRFEPDPT
jgi:hypothetical protein